MRSTQMDGLVMGHMRQIRMPIRAIALARQVSMTQSPTAQTFSRFVLDSPASTFTRLLNSSKPDLRSTSAIDIAGHADRDEHDIGFDYVRAWRRRA